MFEAFHNEKGAFLRELQPGERFIGFYILREKRLEAFRDATRGYYLSLVLSDRSGLLAARVWEGAENIEEEVLQGDVVKVDGEIELYINVPQIRIVRIRPAQPDEYDLRDLLASSKRDVDEMLASLHSFKEQIQEPNLAALVRYFFDDNTFMAEFTQAPAARRLHHAYLHGLLEHCIETLAIAETTTQLYPDIDTDLLFTGVLLHDVGKLREFSWDLDIDLTDEGRLLGHIVLTESMVSQAIQSLPNFPEELALRVRHMLLAHHGRYEWGSPRRPKTLEAIALHHIENLSAQLNRFNTLLDQRPMGEAWTNYDRSLRRNLYAGGEDDLSIEERGRKN